MSEMKRDARNFIGYEYQEKTVPEMLAPYYRDNYPCFGWEEQEAQAEDYRKGASSQVRLRFRRDRKICNKVELTRLQRNFDGCMNEICALEQSPRSTALIWALSAGMAGTVFMALSVFAVTADPPHVLACILWAVPAFIGWIAPYFLYKAILRRKTQKLAPFIEQKYEELYEICEKGNRLLF